jgi:hypothetical protein
MTGWVQDLAAFGASGLVRELHLQSSDDTRECPGQNTFYSFQRNFSFHWQFLDLLQAGQILKERV